MKVRNLHIDDEYITMNLTDTAYEAAKKIKETSIPDIIVINEEKKVQGMIDEFDFVTKIIASDRDPKTTFLKEIMTSTPTVSLETPIENVEEVMEKLEIGVIPVVNEEKELLGVVTLNDIEWANQFQKESLWKKIKRIIW